MLLTTVFTRQINLREDNSLREAFVRVIDLAMPMCICLADASQVLLWGLRAFIFSIIHK